MDVGLAYQPQLVDIEVGPMILKSCQIEKTEPEAEWKRNIQKSNYREQIQSEKKKTEIQLNLLLGFRARCFWSRLTT